MENEAKKTAKTAFSNTVANIVSMVFGMVMIPTITRVLSTGDMGMSSTFITTRNTFVILASLASYSYLYKGMLDYPDEKEQYVYNLVVFNLIAIIISFLICLPFKVQLMKLLSLDNFLFYWLFISSFCFAIFSIGNQYCIFHNMTWIVFFIVLSVGPTSQILSLLLSL